MTRVGLGHKVLNDGKVFYQSRLHLRNRTTRMCIHTYTYLKEWVTQFWHWLGKSEKHMAGHQEGHAESSWAGDDHT